MKKTAKVIISVLLAIVMAFSTLLMSFAASAAKKTTPVIYVHGVNGVQMFENLGTENEKQLPLFGMLQLNLDDNGKAKKGVGPHTYDGPLSEHREFLENDSEKVKYYAEIGKAIGYENLYAFCYDWRTDIKANGEALDKYIDMVKKQKGVSKVSVIGESEGGAVLAAYLDKHMKDNEISKMVFVDSAFEGVSVANAFGGDIVLNKNAEKYLSNLGEGLMGGSLSLLFDILGVATIGIIDGLGLTINAVTSNETLKAELFNAVFKPLLGNVTALYEFIPYDNFDDAMNYMISIGFISKSSPVYKQAVAYHKVMGRLESNLKKAQKYMDIAIVCNYGFPAIPLTSASDKQTDILIDTDYSSAGATVAKFGKTLKTPKNKTYFSKDKIINAATCALPDDTWFVKNINHVEFGEDTDEGRFLAGLVTGKYKDNNLENVKKYGKITQFSVSDGKGNLVEVK